MLAEFRDREAFLSKPPEQFRRGDILFVTRKRKLTAYRPKSWNPNTTPYEGFGAIDYAWPMADSGDQKWQAWKIQMEKAVVHDSLLDPYEDDGDVIAKIIYCGQGRVSTWISSDHINYGVPHGYWDDYNLHWLLDKQREMTVDDVFKTESEWVKFVKDCCEADVVNNGAVIEDEADRAFKYSMFEEFIQKPSNWTLDPSGLTINFSSESSPIAD